MAVQGWHDVLGRGVCVQANTRKNVATRQRAHLGAKDFATLRLTSAQRQGVTNLVEVGSEESEEEAGKERNARGTSSSACMRTGNEGDLHHLGGPRGALHELRPEDVCLQEEGMLARQLARTSRRGRRKKDCQAQPRRLRRKRLREGVRWTPGGSITGDMRARLGQGGTRGA